MQKQIDFMLRLVIECITTSDRETNERQIHITNGWISDH